LVPAAASRWWWRRRCGIMVLAALPHLGGALCGVAGGRPAVGAWGSIDPSRFCAPRVVFTVRVKAVWWRFCPLLSSSRQYGCFWLCCGGAGGWATVRRRLPLCAAVACTEAVREMLQFQLKGAVAGVREPALGQASEGGLKVADLACRIRDAASSGKFPG
jgi:hypothetical protein